MRKKLQKWKLISLTLVIFSITITGIAVISNNRITVLKQTNKSLFNQLAVQEARIILCKSKEN